MKMYVITIFIFLSLIGCNKEENDTTEITSIVGNWKVVSIIEEGEVILKDFPNDSIDIEFKNDGTIYGTSLRNLLTGHYELFDNDSIWVSSIGGTEALETNWVNKFKEIISISSIIDSTKDSTIILLTNSRKSKIIFTIEK